MRWFPAVGLVIGAVVCLGTGLGAWIDPWVGALAGLVLWVVVAFVPFILLRWGLDRIGAYAFIWHRPLFDAALYVAILGGLIFSGGTRWL